MRTFIGWWLQSQTYTDRDLIPRSEEPEVSDGAVQIRYDVVSKHKAKTSVIEMDIVRHVIEVDTRVNVRPDDKVILTDKSECKVLEVELIVPENKLSVVRMWPNRRSAVEVKRVYLS